MNGVLPPWLVLPIALVMMVFVSMHMSRISQGADPESRIRIRVANGWIMLFALAFTAAGFCLVSPDGNPRLFFIVWAISLVLIATTIMLAMVDIFNTLRLVRRVSIRLQSHIAEASNAWSEEQKRRAASDGDDRER